MKTDSIQKPAHVRIHKGTAIRNGRIIADSHSNDSADMYQALACNYPKFFKMDSLCRWAWLGAEALLCEVGNGWIYDGLDKSRIAIVMTTSEGCLEVDKRYAETIQTIPSPGLFVYTLPNIMLGEICIRHGFTGEQLCISLETLDADELLFIVNDLLTNHGATHCLFGKADAVGEHHDVWLFWADAQSIQSMRPENLQSAFEMRF